jgi:hypothetical protein
MRLDPFSPDDLYCVYCHAPAAGRCAVCHALCCADCVELEMGITTQRATCRDCRTKGNALPGWGTFLRAGALLALVLGGLLALAVQLTR